MQAYVAGQLWPSSGQFRLSSRNSGRGANRAESGRIIAHLFPNRANFGRDQLNFGCVRAQIGRHRSEFDRTWPKLAQSGAVRADLSRMWPKSGDVWSTWWLCVFRCSGSGPREERAMLTISSQSLLCRRPCNGRPRQGERSPESRKLGNE